MFDLVQENDYRPLEDAMNDVREFHKAFNHPHPDKLVRMDKSTKEIRAKWMREEIQEFLDAEDQAQEADAMADLIYFALGTMVVGGYSNKQFSHIFSLVQKANMQKLFPDNKPHYNEDGKVLKPEGWIAPDQRIREYIDTIKESNNE